MEQYDTSYRKTALRNIFLIIIQYTVNLYINSTEASISALPGNVMYQRPD